MEVLVRNLDELVDLTLVLAERLIWRTGEMRFRYTAVLACLLYTSTTQTIPVTQTSARLENTVPASAQVDQRGAASSAPRVQRDVSIPTNAESSKTRDKNAALLMEAFPEKTMPALELL